MPQQKIETAENMDVRCSAANPTSAERFKIDCLEQ